MRYSSKLKGFSAEAKNKQGSWRFFDDHTGFYEWADEAVTDYYGNKTLPKYADWQHPQELPLPVIVEQLPSWTRNDPLTEEVVPGDLFWLRDDY